MTWGTADGVLRQGIRRRFAPGRRASSWGILSLLCAIVATLIVGVVSPASAGVGLGVTPNFPGPVVVGQQDVPATLQIVNNADGADALDPIDVTSITLVPSCGSPFPAGPGDCPIPDPNVLALSATGVGEGGTACDGIVFDIVLIDPVQGKYSFTPQTPFQLDVPGSPGDTCRIIFTYDVLRRPLLDSQPGIGGIQTSQIGFATAINPVTNQPGFGGGSSSVTVLAAQVSIVTFATPAPPLTAPLGTPISDTATVTGVAGGPTPTGTVVFNAYGPDDATCAGAPAFTSAAIPLVAGVPPTASANSGPFVPGAPGTYRWTAEFIPGDGNYDPAETACNDPNESSVVTAATITTQATPTVTIGSPIVDNATITGTPGGPSPTGTVTFTLFGPDDLLCTGAPVFNSGAQPVTPGAPPVSTATSGPFVPTLPGTYRWIAAYSGDGAYPPVTSICNDANETTVVLQATPTIVTFATPGPVVIGSPISDTATVTGLPDTAPVPTGTVTFTAFGPDNATCTGPAAFTSAAIPLVPGPAGPPQDATAASGPFVPTLPGTYRWIAFFDSGDLNYPDATTLCNDPNEASVVTQAPPTIVTNATPNVTLTESITDTATVSGPVGAPVPTGTVTFTVFGPDDATCTGPVVFTSANRPLVPGPAAPPPDATATSEPFTPLAPGTYRWIAFFDSGDLNYPDATSLCNDANETSVVAATPTIQVDKTADPLSRPEPGGTFTFNVVVTNTSPQVLTIQTLTDDIYGNIATQGTCTTAVGTVLQPSPGPGNTYSCSFTGPFNGNAGASQTDTVTVTATNPTGIVVTDNDDAVVTLTPVPPEINIVKDVTPASRTEPGGDFTYTITVTNPGTVEAVTITSLTDSVYGDLSTRGTCTTAIGTVLATNGGTYTCSFTAPFNGAAGASLTDIATVNGVDDDGQTVTDSDDAVVTITPLPTINVDKTVTPASRPEPGGDFTYTVVVTNTSAEVLTIQTLTDDVYGDLSTRGTCTTAIGTVLQPTPGPGNTYTCTFTAPFMGNAGEFEVDTVTVTATNPTGSVVTDTDDARVDITPVPPVINIVKDATPLSRTEPGGDFTYNITVTNPGTLEAVTITSLTDSVYGDLSTRGTCTTAIGTVLATNGGTYTCSFTAPFTGAAGASLTDIATVVGVDDDGQTATDSDDAVVTITPLPTINVDKTADPLTRPEPGGDFTFNVVVTNTSSEVLTIQTLTDDVYGDLSTRGTCTTAIGTVLQPSPGPGNTYSCAFTAPFTGSEGDFQVDTVTVTATNPTGSVVTDTDDARVDITGMPPLINIVKDATPLTRPEPGGDFTYNITVTNPGTLEAVTITSLTDSVYGDLSTRGTCTTAIGTVLAINGGSYTCSFTAPFTGNAGDSLTDVATVVGEDDDGTQVTDSDDAVVTLTDNLPIISVDKTATPASLPEPGGTFTFNVVVTNLSSEPVTIQTLTDNIYGNIATQGTCTTAVGTVLAASPGPGNTYSCSFTGPFTGNAGDSQTDIVTATATDDDGNPASDTDDAIVTITNVNPAILVEKSATPSSRPEPGGQFTFSVVVSNTGPEALTITSLTDNIYGNIATQGTCTTAIGTVLQPGGTYSCSFTGPFTGAAGASQTDIVTVIGVDDDGTQVTDSDDATVTITGVPPTVTIVKTPSPASLPEPGGQFTFNFVVTNTSADETVTITSLTDDIYGNLNGRGTCATGAVLPPGGTYSCSFTVTFNGNAGATQRDVATVRVVDDDGEQAVDDDDAIITITDVPPVITVVKTATPLVRNEPGGSFTFDVLITNVGTETVTIDTLTDNVYGNLNGRGTCAIGAVLPPGGTYRCSFNGDFFGNAGASQTDIVTASGVDNDGSRTTARDDAIVRLVDVPPTVTVLKDADPISRPEPGGPFTFTVTITNTSFEPVTVVSIIDDVYGDLNGRGTCAVGAVLQPGAFYRCQFTVEFRGPGGSSQVDIVTAVVEDNDRTRASDSDDARISITPVATPIVVQPPQQLPRTGGDSGGPTRLAMALLLAGLMMMGATVRSRRPGLAMAAIGTTADRFSSAFGSTAAWFTAPPAEPGLRRIFDGMGESLRQMRPVADPTDTFDDTDDALYTDDTEPDDTEPDDTDPPEGPPTAGPPSGGPSSGGGGGGGGTPPSNGGPSGGGSGSAVAPAPVERPTEAEWSAVVAPPVEPPTEAEWSAAVVAPAPAPRVIHRQDSLPPAPPEPVWTPKPQPTERYTRLI